MLRRLIDGVVLALLAWFILVRLDAGQVALGIVLALVIAFTGWRIFRLWQKYKHLLAEYAAAQEAKLSDDPQERLRAERILRSRQMMQVADMTLVSGFVLGAALSNPSAGAMGGDGAGGFDGAGGDGGDGGGYGGGDMGGGFGGDAGGGM
ncbi:MAG: hypothetical protein GKS02_07275 [Alphaproteobacteria bacterium]|nr:hypothetical protein [Alphaproteobacteria bacterium]